MSDRPGALVLAARRLRPADVVAAEARVRALADEVAALRAGVEAEGADVARWERLHAAVTGAALAELGAAERLVRRVARLRAEVERLAAALRAPAPARVGRRRRAAPA
ncbi:MAG: molecular chaperone DnaJ, partial [Anaeromyxobacteraceae bacterium]